MQPYAASSSTAPKVAVVVPAYRVRRHILSVLERMPPSCWRVYVIDDACPEASGAFVRDHCGDARVRVLCHKENQGVGGATMTGYRQALRDGADIVVKVDGDGQMDPREIPRLVAPIVACEADYTKGNRFFDLGGLSEMPAVRLMGNAVLSFFTKISSGYWDLFDPTNGFTAVHAEVLGLLPLEKVDRRYFFESDMLFRLNTIRAVVRDVPMRARYGEETSSLVVWREAGRFLVRNIRNTLKRIFYNYYLRSFGIPSVELAAGAASTLLGAGIGAGAWWRSIATGTPATSGTVMLAALPVLLGTQLLLSFLMHDVQGVPVRPIHRLAPSLAGAGSMRMEPVPENAAKAAPRAEG